MKRFGATTSAFALLLAGTNECEGQLLRNWNLRRVASRLLQEDDRHPNTVMENEQDMVENHPNPVKLRNSYFTEKYCVPDLNGYYGSTMGTPFEITFGFEAETVPGADLDQVSKAVHDSIETALLTTFFPTMCQMGGIRYDSEVTGFHFDPSATQFAKSCRVLMNDENTCGVYVGTVRIYGEEGDALAIIRDHLDREGNGANIHEHLRRLFSVDGNEFVGVSSGDDVESYGMTAGQVAVLVISLMMLSVAVVAVASMHVRRRRNRRVQESTSPPLAESEGSRSVSDDHDGESVETVDLQPGSAVVIAGGRPKTIIVDPEAVKRYQADLL